jgi:uncharacterized Zn-binding protein involved in type VI secretion
MSEAKGISLDSVHKAGGTLIAQNQTWFKVDGHPIITKGDLVEPHPVGIPHSLPNTMAGGVEWFTIDGHPVVVKDKPASCGHTAEGLDWFTIVE